MPTERRIAKRGVAKDGNKAKKARRGGKAGSGAVDSVSEEGRVSVAPTMPTEAATVAVPETAVAEKEGSLAAPGTAEAEKEGSLAAPETAEAEMEDSLAAETETAVETAAETKAVEKTDALEKEGNAAVEAGTVEEVEGHEAETEAGTVEEVEGHEAETEAGTVEEVEEEESVEEAGTVEEVEEGASVEEASLGDGEDDCDDGSQGVPQEGVVAPVLINAAVAAIQPSQDMGDISALAFRVYKNFDKVDPNLVFGNNELERFQDMYRMAEMSELDKEAELAKCHDALKAHQDMEKLQEHQQQLDRMRASVAEQMKRREVEALRSRNQVSFLV
jgi:hypothetical protein